MIRYECVQGSQEWLQARLGIPTCSGFDKIISPKKLQPSTQATLYRNQLVAEWLLGFPLNWGEDNGWMERGRDMEAEARAFYELQQDVDVESIGFILRDDEKAGGSPDGLVGGAGVLEIKCPALHTMVGYLVDPNSLAEKYASQIQGYLYLTDREWCDILAYSPVLPAVQVRIPRDERYLSALHVALNAFIGNLEAVKEQLREHKQATVAEAMAGATV